VPATAPPAPPSRAATWCFARYVRGLARRHFAAVHWNGARSAGASGQPVLFVANHTNWWDGFLAFLVGRRLGFVVHVLMDAANLERYRMFRQVGALPLDRRSAGASYRDLDAAAAHLRRAGTGLWIFPQGARRPAAAPLGGIGHGAAQLWLRSEGAPLIWPVAIRYAYLGEQLPEAFLWLGAPRCPGGGNTVAAPAARRRLTAEIECRLAAGVAELDERLEREDLAGLSPLESGRLSINKRLDRVRHSVGLLRGPFHPRNG